MIIEELTINGWNNYICVWLDKKKGNVLGGDLIL